MRLAGRLVVACLLTAGCHGEGPVTAAARATSQVAGDLHVVAEGPCSRLSVQPVGGRTFVVYGDTGYDLHDWSVGERLAAAESVVEIRGGEAFRVDGFLRGLPTNSGGYVAADLRLGGSLDRKPWLVAVDTRYATRDAGSLFERESSGYVFEGGSFRKHNDGSPVDLPDEAASLPALPEPCDAGAGQRFVKLAAATSGRGDVFVAGRCAVSGPVATRGAPIVVAFGAARASRWVVGRTPESHVLDGVVNVGLFARRGDDAYLVAYEPFKSAEERQPYLARWDGRAWSQIETGLPEGLMSVSGSDDGTLWIAGGRALYRRRPGETALTKVPLPPLRFATDPHPATLRVHTVRVVAADDVWVEGTYRVRVREKDADVELRSGVLFRSRPSAAHYCDAREPAAKAFVRVE